MTTQKIIGYRKLLNVTRDATLKELKKQDKYKDFEKTAAFLEREMKAAAKENGIDLQVNRFGSMINPFFTKEKVVDFKSAQTSDTKKFKTFFIKK